MTISMNGHVLAVAHNTSGVQMAECKCGAPIHKRMPNRRKPNTTLEEFKREAYIKHQQHLTNIIERQRLKIALNAKYGKTATYQETDSMRETPDFTNDPPKVDYTTTENEFKGCPAVRMERGAHRYKAINTTTIYCTQCGDARRIGGVAEETVSEFNKGNLALISRALYFYSEHPEYLPETRLDDCDNASALAYRIHKEHFLDT